MRIRRVAPIAATIAAGALLQLGLPREAAPLADYESPFGCGQEWLGSTRADHSPSPKAIDFNRDGDLGDLTVSAAPGRVSKIGDYGQVSYGKFVVVDHGNGESTVFAHLKAVWVVRGQLVDQGSWIGLVGATGGVSGPHLHFEERQDYEDRSPWFGQVAFKMGSTLVSGNCGDMPVAGDWDGDGDDEVGTFRRGATGSFQLAQGDALARSVPLGVGTSQPVVGDWDGDGVDGVGSRGRREWTLLTTGGDRRVVRFGTKRGTAVAGDWDGNGHDDLGVWYPGTRTFELRSPSGSVSTVVFGGRASQPLVGDWDGDGADDLGAFTPSTGTVALRTVGGDGTVSRTAIPFGSSTSLMVAGDWDGDGRDDLGSWNPETARWVLRTAAADDPSMQRAGTRAFRFGHRR